MHFSPHNAIIKAFAGKCKSRRGNFTKENVSVFQHSRLHSGEFSKIAIYFLLYVPFYGIPVLFIHLYIKKMPPFRQHLFTDSFQAMFFYSPSSSLCCPFSMLWSLPRVKSLALHPARPPPAQAQAQAHPAQAQAHPPPWPP